MIKYEDVELNFVEGWGSPEDRKESPKLVPI